MAVTHSNQREFGLAFASPSSPTLHLYQYCDASTLYHTISMIYCHSPTKVRLIEALLSPYELRRVFVSLALQKQRNSRMRPKQGANALL